MRQAPDIRFIGMEPSDALAAAAREKVATLDMFCPFITGCHAYVALRDAFDDMKRQVEEAMRRMQAFDPVPEPPPGAAGLAGSERTT